jgi:hypothetical protein
MSWMDSWSRPSKYAATLPPLYLLPGGEATPYCHSCGRVIGSRKIQTSKNSKETVKYCSERCRHQKPGDVDHVIEQTYVSLLNGEEPAIRSSGETPNGAPTLRKDRIEALPKKTKGDPRVTVLCSTVEELVFGSRYDPEKVFGRRKNRAKRGAPEIGQWRSVDMEDGSSQTYGDSVKRQSEEEDISLTLQDEQQNPFTFGAGKVRPAHGVSDVNFSVGGERGWAEKIEESEELKQRQLDGQRKAEEREAVRCAARRLCAFGVAVIGEVEGPNEGAGAARRKQKKTTKRNFDNDAPSQEEKRKKCETLLKDGSVVEASFAKGEWGIRWRE